MLDWECQLDRRSRNRGGSLRGLNCLGWQHNSRMKPKKVAGGKLRHNLTLKMHHGSDSGSGVAGLRT